MEMVSEVNFLPVGIVVVVATAVLVMTSGRPAWRRWSELFLIIAAAGIFILLVAAFVPVVLLLLTPSD